jgi:RES domain-containing protein
MAEVIGWRIVKEKHASTAFSGEGARLFEGRWNSAGVPIVYCSEHLSLAALEILVHTQAATIHHNFRTFRAVWDSRIMLSIAIKDLPMGWNRYPPSAASRSIGNNWVKSGRTPVLAVPSVIVPRERTFLLNPKHSDFKKIKIEDSGTFVLDQRLRQ